MTEENIIGFHHIDIVDCDSNQVAAIYRDLGTVSAGQVINRALAEMAVTVAGIIDLMNEKDAKGVLLKLRRLQSISENLGLTSLVKAVENMRDCMQKKNDIALEAVWARLLRVAEKSLAPDMDLLGRHQN